MSCCCGGGPPQPTCHSSPGDTTAIRSCLWYANMIRLRSPLPHINRISSLNVSAEVNQSTAAWLTHITHAAIRSSAEVETQSTTNLSVLIALFLTVSNSNLSYDTYFAKNHPGNTYLHHEILINGINQASFLQRSQNR